MNSDNPLGPLLDRTTLSILCSCSPQAIDRHTRSGRFKTNEIGMIWVDAEVLAFYHKHRNKPPNKWKQKKW